MSESRGKKETCTSRWPTAHMSKRAATGCDEGELTMEVTLNAHGAERHQSCVIERHHSLLPRQHPESSSQHTHMWTCSLNIAESSHSEWIAGISSSPCARDGATSIVDIASVAGAPRPCPHRSDGGLDFGYVVPATNAVCCMGCVCTMHDMMSCPWDE